MLYFNRNGVWFTIKIANDAIYSRELLEKQIHSSLLGLQNLKDRSGDIEQMRFEKPGEYVIKSVFGRDDITIYPSKLQPKKLPDRLRIPQDQFNIFPQAIIDVFDSDDNLVGFDVSLFFGGSIIKTRGRYIEDAPEIGVADLTVLFSEDEADGIGILKEIEAITDDDIWWDYDSSSSSSCTGFLPAYPGEPPDSECRSCGLPDPWGLCSAPDTAFSAMNEVGPYYYTTVYGTFAVGSNIAYWFNHDYQCEPSGTVIQVIKGGNSWTSGDMQIWVTGGNSSSGVDTFILSGVELRSFEGSDVTTIESYGIAGIDASGHSYKKVSTASVVPFYVTLLDFSRGVSDASRFIYGWTTFDRSYSYFEETSADDLSTAFCYTDNHFLTSVEDPSVDSRLGVCCVTLDDGVDYVVVADLSQNEYVYFQSEVFDFYGTPFYMYSCYFTSYSYDAENDSREKIVYGCIYKGKHYRLVFDSTGYESFEHQFVSAICINADGEEKTIEFEDAYLGLKGKYDYTRIKNFRAGAYSETLEKVVTIEQPSP